jgi:NMD protein affecting ribosome stability and mRNA decay
MSEIDFSCRVCGKQCDSAPLPPVRAVCEDCCDDHDYQYERELRGHFCVHCGKPAPLDWFDE